MTESMKDWALQYARMGFAVFPIKPRDKTPLTRHGFKDATTDNTVISSWWDKYPNANIAVATGSRSGGLVVIDLDVKHPPINGISNCDEWQMRNGFFPRTLICETGSGGRHLYFKTTANFKSKNGILPGIDIKSEGGYVVVPPSSNDKGQYRYINNLPIADANEKVLIFLTGKESYGKPMKETPEGNRDNTMLAQTYKLARDFDNREEALEIALVMNQKCIPPLEEKIIESMLDRAYKKIREESRAKVVNFDEIKPEEVEWLWYPYIPLGKLTIIAGEAGIGKTFTESKVAAIISTGDSFPGENEKRSPRIVCIQNTEDGIADTIVKRLMAAGADLKMVKMINTEEKPLTFSDPRIEDFMKEFKPAAMIFDPFQSFFGAGIDLNRSNETRPIFDKLLCLAQKYKVAVILVMHLSKMTSAAAINRVLGSVDIVGAVRSVLVITKHPRIEKHKVICHEKSNLAPAGESICYSIENGAVKWGEFCTLSADDCLLAGKQKREKDKLQIAVEFIESRLKICKKVDVNEIREIVVDEMGISYKTAQRAKNKLGLIEERDGFAGQVFWRLP